MECRDLSLLQLVIFLYLLDSETSYVVMASSGIGTVIEFWKVTKAMNVTIDRSRGYPMIKFEDKAGEQQHSFVALPLALLRSATCFLKCSVLNPIIGCAPSLGCTNGSETYKQMQMPQTDQPMLETET